MKVSTRARYGVRLMLELALHYGQGPLFLKSIARSQEISEKYLGQIIIPLKARGLVQSHRGAHGGYELQREPSRITLREIMEVLEGDLSLVDCLSHPSACSRVERCAARDVWGRVGQAMARTLDAITLQDLVESATLKGGQAPDYSI